MRACICIRIDDGEKMNRRWKERSQHQCAMKSKQIIEHRQYCTYLQHVHVYEYSALAFAPIFGYARVVCPPINGIRIAALFIIQIEFNYTISNSSIKMLFPWANRERFNWGFVQWRDANNEGSICGFEGEAWTGSRLLPSGVVLHPLPTCSVDEENCWHAVYRGCERKFTFATHHCFLRRHGWNREVWLR